MRLLQGSWSEVLILSLVFRSLPTTVAAASVAAKEKASNGGVKKWKLKFAPDFALNENMATDSGLEEFYSHVSFQIAPNFSRALECYTIRTGTNYRILR